MPTFEVQILNKLECLLAIASPASCKPSALEDANPDSAVRGAALHVEPSLAVQWEDNQHLESSSQFLQAARTDTTLRTRRGIWLQENPERFKFFQSPVSAIT